MEPCKRSLYFWREELSCFWEGHGGGRTSVLLVSPATRAPMSASLRMTSPCAPLKGISHNTALLLPTAIIWPLSSLPWTPLSVHSEDIPQKNCAFAPPKVMVWCQELLIAVACFQWLCFRFNPLTRFQCCFLCGLDVWENAAWLFCMLGSSTRLLHSSSSWFVWISIFYVFW